MGAAAVAVTLIFLLGVVCTKIFVRVAPHNRMTIYSEVNYRVGTSSIYDCSLKVDGTNATVQHTATLSILAPGTAFIRLQGDVLMNINNATVEEVIAVVKFDPTTSKL